MEAFNNSRIFTKRKVCLKARCRAPQIYKNCYECLLEISAVERDIIGIAYFVIEFICHFAFLSLRVELLFSIP